MTGQILTITAAAAAWGIATGFGLAAKLYLDLAEHSTTSVVLKLAAGLVIAVGAAAFLDWLKEHLPGQPHHARRLSLGSLVTSIVVLAAFELVTIALDSVHDVWWEREHELASLAAVVTSPEEPWAFLWPEDIPDVRALRGALITAGTPALQRVYRLLPEDLRAHLHAEHERDREIAARLRPVLEARLRQGSLATALARGENTSLPLPPIRTAEEVTVSRRDVTRGLNAALMRRDLFADTAFREPPNLNQAVLLRADPHLPVRTLVRLNRTVLQRELSRGLIVPIPATTLAAGWQLAGMIGLWSVAGATIGLVLALAVAFPGHTSTQRLVRGIGAGALAGGLAAPCLIPIYLLVLRLGGLGWLMWARPDQAHLVVASYGLDRLPGPFAVLSMLLSGGWWGVVLLLLALVVSAGLALRRESWIPLAAIAGVLCVLSLPLLDRTVLVIATSMAKVWLVPGITLGALIPVLRRGRGQPSLWGLISLVAAAVLGGLTALRARQEAGLDVIALLGAILAAALLLAAFLLRRGRLSWEAWPVVAVALGIIVGSEVHALHATFRDVFGEMQQLTGRISPQAESERLAAPRLTGQPLAALLESRLLRQPYEDPKPLPEPRPRPEMFLSLAQQTEVKRSLDREARHLTEVSRLLEITLVASLGFWATTGLLAAWTLREPATTDEHPVVNGGA